MNPNEHIIQLIRALALDAGIYLTFEEAEEIIKAENLDESTPKC